MLPVLILLFTVVPILELALLLNVGALIGPWPTVALVLVTGVVGATLARWQGILTLRKHPASPDPERPQGPTNGAA